MSKTEEIKNALKPLIKQITRQTIKEMLFEDGFLSVIIKETIHGMKEDLIIESKRNNSVEKENSNSSSYKTLIESMKNVSVGKSDLDEIGNSGYSGLEDRFSEPKRSEPNRSNIGYMAANPFAQPNAVNGSDPNDPGVDLSKFGIDPNRKLFNPNKKK